ncbi:omptin family outer membrane protease [candidate division KSB3 bacterium]|uniref:Omptin family outer membrane protease n=1 Tax=candidate division KSB3 bacterium TaxID=2044937 RepID=A0A9D5JSB8_9BACT|nr:omptin family outer membrane protease [candidate division KSB3 bacterium]MBD3323358.1 omptin family outer membrane protease [candidate division KSB3 bacterium]
MKEKLMHMIRLLRPVGISLLIIFCVFCVTPVAGWGMIASNASRLTLYEEDSGLHMLLGASVDVENGDMTYTIQGPEGGGWKSELAWDLENVVYLGVNASATFLKDFQTNVGFWKSVTEDSGLMKDSDWLFADYGDSRAVYSESDITVDAFHLDINFRYNLLRSETLLLGPMVGYSYRNWQWETGEGYQTSINPYQFYSGPLPPAGESPPSITYEQQLQIPYVGVALSLFPERFLLNSNVYALYSPLAYCEDEDDHVLRSKLNTGESDGTFFAVGGDIRWQYRNRWSFTGKVTYTTYDLEGDQDQYFYAGSNVGTRFTDIDLSIEGSQVYLGFVVGYSFL